VGGGSPLKEQEKLADWPGIVMMSVGCWVIVGMLGGAGELIIIGSSPGHIPSFSILQQLCRKAW
jgi:hypothetical protein